MELPKIKGHTILTEIGEGATGLVYEARRDDGSHCAIKFFESMASNPSLLDGRISRVIDGGAQDITVPVLAKALDVRPACVVMPLLGEKKPDGFQPRTLQAFFADYQQSDSTWPFLIKLANRLATMHTVKVAHGNLKPGNIFIGVNGGPLLADYASGLMPGVHRIGYSDALLYSPPEQLRNPQGYLEEEGYRWDVYAFGVLAFRLLAGSFPRCDALFTKVSPAPGSLERFSIDADYEGIASGLEDEPGFMWPAEPIDDVDARRREMLNFCLSLDPQGRPGDMREVSRYFGSIDDEIAADQEKERLEFLRVRAEKKRKRGLRYATLATLVAGGLGAGWGVTQMQRQKEAKVAEDKFETYRAGAEEKVSDLEERRDRALKSEEAAITKQKELQGQLADEKVKVEEEIRTARVTNEVLFDWVLENGVSGLPMLEGRKERLGYLIEKIDKQLETVTTRANLGDQEALLRLRKAELYLAMGDVEQGTVSLKMAIAAGGLSGDLIAGARLRILLIQSRRDRAALEKGIEESEGLIASAWAENEGKRLRAAAALDLVKARMWDFKGDGEKALESYLDCLQGYKKLEAMFPEVPGIGLTVGRTYLSAALAAEGEGSVADAARLRQEAVEAFKELAAGQENPDPELQYQIASATAAKAVSLWQQGKTFESDQLARKGVIELSELAQKMPDDFRVIVDLVSQKGIIATALRDEGNPEEALDLLKAGIEMLEEGLEQEPKNWNARYLLASVKWQYAGILGQNGKSEEELKYGGESYEELKGLLKSPMRNPNPSAVRKSLAYLCGDLGHSAALKKKKELAVSYLEESKRYWQELHRDEGDQIEIREGYHWAVNRLAELGVE